MFTASYLTKSRYGVFHVRYPLPCSLHPKGQRDYIRISLATREPRQAADLTAMIRYAGHLLIKRFANTPMRYIEKKELIRQHFQQLLERHKQDMLASGPLPKKQIEGMERSVAFWDDLSREGHDGNWTPSEDVMTDAFKSMGLTLPEDLEQRQQLVRDWNLGSAWAAKEALRFSMNLRSFTSPPIPVRTSQESAIVSPEAVGHTLGDVMAAFVKEKTPSWAKATKLSYSRFQTFLLMQVGENTPMSKIDVHTSRKVKDALGETDLTSRTRNEYLRFYKGFFKWAVNMGYGERILFDGLTFSEENNKLEKLDYTLPQLRQIRQHLIDHKESIETSRYWCSMLGMYTGARLNELTQLQTSDVFEEEGVWVIRITDAGDKQTLKNKHSRRLVPIHPELTELGLLEFVEGTTSGPLFPAQLKRARKGADMSRWYNEQLLVDVGLKSEQLDFHSFRRSMNSMLLKQGIPTGVIQSICGHKRQGMSETYNPTGYPPKVKLEALATIRISPSL